MATQTGPPNLSHPHKLDTGDHSDWEYEYDENETEEIYFTLDLTTFVPDAIQQKTYAKNGKLIRSDAPENNTGPDQVNAQENDPETNDCTNAPEDEAVENPAPESEIAGKLQILDLHTRNPYVKFNNGFYSCHWHTDLGTQFWVTQPGVVEEPKLSGHVLDVISSSQTRLVARPANLKRKRDVPEPERRRVGQAAGESVVIDEHVASDVSDAESTTFNEYQNPDQPMAIPRQKIKDPHLEAQASFMERLSAIKLRKGEPDAHKIPMKIPVYYKGAHNQDELRAAAHNTKTNKNDNGNKEKDKEAPASTAQPTPERRASLATSETGETGEATTDTPEPSVTRIRKPAFAPRRGARRGGAPTTAARRSNLGLDLMGDTSTPVRRKPGRPSNAEKARRAAEAAALVAGEGGEEGESDSFALDPRLDPTGASASASRSITTAPPTQEPEPEPEAPKPRKGRRNRAQMAEARRLEQVQKARAAAEADKRDEAIQAIEANKRSMEAASKAATFATDASGSRVEVDYGRATRRRRAAIEAEEAQAEAARRAVVRPGQVGVEMEFRFDGAGDVDGVEEGGEGEGEGGGEGDGEEASGGEGDGA